LGRGGASHDPLREELKDDERFLNKDSALSTPANRGSRVVTQKGAGNAIQGRVVGGRSFVE
jgi:hypothetical protein